MAKKRKGINQDDAKARQRKASKAAGQQILAFHGKTKMSDGFTQKTYSVGAASSRPLAGFPRDTTQVGESFAGKTYVDQLWLHNQAMRVGANIPKSKTAQSRFLASEKKKSGKSTAKNTKRRER